MLEMTAVGTSRADGNSRGFPIDNFGDQDAAVLSGSKVWKTLVLGQQVATCRNFPTRLLNSVIEADVRRLNRSSSSLIRSSFVSGIETVPA